MRDVLILFLHFYCHPVRLAWPGGLLAPGRSSETATPGFGWDRRLHFEEADHLPVLGHWQLRRRITDNYKVGLGLGLGPLARRKVWRQLWDDQLLKDIGHGRFPNPDQGVREY